VLFASAAVGTAAGAAMYLAKAPSQNRFVLARAPGGLASQT
jgi:hypothetical protein